MKRFTATEMAALALGAVLFVGGASMVIWPPSGPVPHAASALGAGSITVIDTLTPAKSRLLGVMSMALATGLTVITVNYKKP
jgi:hypothetical protein